MEECNRLSCSTDQMVMVRAEMVMVMVMVMVRAEVVMVSCTWEDRGSGCRRRDRPGVGRKS